MENLFRLESHKRCISLMSKYFEDLKNTDKKIAWVTSVGPAEILQAFGFKVYFPEYHASLIGLMNKAVDYIPYANAIGYSHMICSYLTSDIGSYLKKETPLKELFNISEIPKPDVIVYNTNQCIDVQNWFNFYGREFGVPVIGITSPVNVVDEVTENLIKDMATQIRDMIPVLEKVSGKKFDIDRFKETLKISYECTKVWKECQYMRAHIPSPATYFDFLLLLPPAVVLRGLPEAVEFYRGLKEELQERIDKGISGVENEKVRIYWEGMPIWGRVGMLSELFNELGAAVVAATYFHAWVFESFKDYNKEPFESMARAYLEVSVARSENVKEEMFSNWMKEFKVDGIIFHESMTCPYVSNSGYGLPKRLQEKTGIPYLIINGDLNDMRLFSDEQARTSIETFVEQIRG